MAAHLWSVVFHANDAVSLARFWGAALGWAYGEDQGRSSVSGGDGTLRRLEFVTAPNEKRSPNWMHFDLASKSVEHQRATVGRLVGLGARHIDVGQGPDAEHVVLADLEGNEFCILEPGNSFVDDAGLLGSLTCDGSPAAGYFWSEVLGWLLVWDQDGETAIRSRDGGVFVTFGGPPRHEQNRLRLAVAPADDSDDRTEVDRLVSLGAQHIGSDSSRAVMADPDGNEFWVLTRR
jgi:catechol 2,3-dioxygenase-like lactoylglutathione lyase family enzyme